MVTKQNFFLLLPLITVVQSLNLSGIYDVNAIDEFVEDIDSKVFERYKWNESILDEREKNSILKLIVSDLVSTIDHLNHIEPYHQHRYWSNKFYNFIDVFEEYQLKNGMALWSVSLMSFKGIIDEKLNTIQSFLVLVHSINNQNFENSSDFCDFINGAVQFIGKDNFVSSVAVYYQNLIKSILPLIESFEWRYNCNRMNPSNGQLFKYCRVIMVAHFKLWSIIYYTGLLQARCQDEPSSFLTRSIRSQIVNDFKNSIEPTARLAQHQNRYMYRCDSNNVQTDFYELGGMIQTIIIEEKSLSTKQTCDNNCDLGSIESSLNHSECSRFIDCRFIDTSFEICESDGTTPRRYEWFKDSKGVVYGNNEQCHNKVKSVESYYYASALRNCDYCVCTCQRETLRKDNVVTVLSFREQITNLQNNLVVVGVRFIKKYSMIHIQIKEGKVKGRMNDNMDNNKTKITSNDSIDDSEYSDFDMDPDRNLSKNDGNFDFETIEWKELESFDYNDVTKKYFVKFDDHAKLVLRSGADYGNPSMINFDDLIAPPGFVVTGVRFNYAGNSVISRIKSGPIEMQIRVTPFDYLQGKLVHLDRTYWMIPQNSQLRKKLYLVNPDNPTKSHRNIYDSKSDQFIEFVNSDLKKDAGQSTVPFFDAQEVQGDPEFPLGGLGIIHRGSEGYGGFLALKIYDLDVSHTMTGKLNPVVSDENFFLSPA